MTYLNNKQTKDCCGCKACYEICNHNAIVMKTDALGFAYPEIDENKCTHCNLCRSVCPFENGDNVKFDSEKSVSVVAVHKDSEVCFNSSSGGAYSCLCEVLDYGNTYFAGVTIDENFKVYHDISEDYKIFRKSKYVMSDTNGIFKKVKACLEEGKRVVFSSSPCQVAALKLFLRKDYENLITVDVVCRGAPSQKLFDECLKYTEKEENNKIIKYIFKNKKPVNGKINCRSCEILFENGKSVCRDSKSDLYLKFFNSYLCKRESCNSCNFYTPDRVGDITLMDAWHIEKIYPELNPLEGVSAIMFNSDKVKNILDEMKKEMNTYDISTQKLIELNRTLRIAGPHNTHRNLFIKNYLKGKDLRKNIESSLKKSLNYAKIMAIKKKIFHK